jgi:hypothetical protein
LFHRDAWIPEVMILRMRTLLNKATQTQLIIIGLWLSTPATISVCIAFQTPYFVS